MKYIIALCLALVSSLAGANYLSSNTTDCASMTMALVSGVIRVDCVAATGTPVPPVVPPVIVPPVTPPVIPATGCGRSQVITGNLNWNIGNGVPSYFRNMIRDQAYVFAFTTGPASSVLASISAAEYAGSTPARTLVISKSPCDFTLGNGAIPSDVGKQPSAYFTVGTPNPYGYPVLLPNTQYYVNFRNAGWDGVDTCQVGESCGFVLYVSH